MGDDNHQRPERPAAPWLAPKPGQPTPPPPPDWLEIPQRQTPPPAATTDRLAERLLATQPPEQREQFHRDKYARRGILRVAFIAALVVGAIMALNQFTDLGDQTRIRALDAGDCIEMPDNHFDSFVQRVDCAEPHDAEVIGYLGFGADDRLEACAELLTSRYPVIDGQLPGDAEVRVLTAAMLDRCVVHSPTTTWTGAVLGPGQAQN